MEWKKELESSEWLKKEQKIGKRRNRADFAASLGISDSLVRDYIYLTNLDPDVLEIFVSLGSILPKGCYISKARIRKLVNLPKKEQMRAAKQLIEDAGMEWPD